MQTWIRVLLAHLCVVLPHAADWPQFLGPERNGSSDERIAGSWAEREPEIVWKKAVGEGFAGPVVAGPAVLVFYRRADREILEAFDASTGAPKWKNEQPTTYEDDFGFDPGPRAVPAIHDGRVYAMGAEGLIRCVDFQTGKTLWSVPAKDQFKARKGFFGMACSPLVEGDSVILNVGGEDRAGIIALDRQTGKLRWKARRDEASYSSPTVAMFDGQRELVAFTREAVCVLDPGNGEQKAEFPWRSRMQASVNAATPLVSGNLVFVTASYGAGAVLLEWQRGGFKKVWSNDDSLSSHYATPVLYAGFLYGFHGRQEYRPSLRCVELKTGKVKWSKDGYGAGTITRAGDQLLVLRELGELELVQPTPDKFISNGIAQIVGSGTRAYPAFANQRLYARDKTSLVCVKIP